MSTLEDRQLGDRPPSPFEGTKVPAPVYPPLRTSMGDEAGGAQAARPVKPATGPDLQQALGHWASDAHPAPTAKASSASAAPQGPSPTKGADERAAIESVQVVTRTDSVLSLRPALIFERIPWNTQDKHLAYSGMQAAAGELRRAEAAFKSAADPKAKEKALQQFEAAAQRAESATHKLRNYVMSQLPLIEGNDPQMQQYKRWEAQTQAAAAKSKDAKERDELQAWQEAFHGDQKTRHTELKTEIEQADYREAVQQRHHHRVSVDGEEISLVDHVNAYSTTVEHGLDGKATHESRGGRQGTTVEQALKTAPFSESVKKILKTISASEGGFTTVNTYDQAMLTWGMLQWTGGSGGDLETALRIIKRVAPAAFAARFTKYGIDVRGNDLVVTQPQSEPLVGEPAAKAVQDSPALTGVMSRAGMDPAIQVAELTAALQTKIDEPLAATLMVELHGHTARIRVGDIFTSEYGVGVVADATVHGGLPKPKLTKHLQEFLTKHGYEPKNVAVWAAAAEQELLPVVVAGWTQRAHELEKNGCSRAAGSFTR